MCPQERVPVSSRVVQPMQSLSADNRWMGHPCSAASACSSTVEVVSTMLTPGANPARQRRRCWAAGDNAAAAPYSSSSFPMRCLRQGREQGAPGMLLWAPKQIQKLARPQHAPPGPQSADLSLACSRPRRAIPRRATLGGDMDSMASSAPAQTSTWQPISQTGQPALSRQSAFGWTAAGSLEALSAG